jgi:protein SCO1/2
MMTATHGSFAFVRVALLVAVTLGLGWTAQAQGVSTAAGPVAAGPPVSATPSQLKGITIQQKLDSQIPLDVHFRDESGRDVTLRQYFDKRPVILSFVYFRCPMLCPQVVQGLARSLAGLTFKAGQQYTILTVSFDPGDKPSDAAEKKKIALAELGQPDAGDAWHFLTGDEASIASLTDAVGFHYRWDPASQQFFHAAGIMLLTPEGTLSRYFYGIQFSSVDLRLGLVEASHNRVGSVADTVLLYCSHYDALTGKYDWVVTRLLSLAGVLTLAILGTLLTVLVRSEPSHPKTP